MAPPDLGRLGLPPEDFDTRELVLANWSAPMYRVHRGDREALYFGRSGGNRFDDPEQGFGVLYASGDLDGGFGETFAGVSSVTATALAASGWSVIEARRPLRLCELRDHGLARIGADGRLCTGSRQDAQRWSRAIWTHPFLVDGICYPARTNLSRTSVAIFDRAQDAVESHYQGSFMDPENQLATAALLERYGAALILG